MHRYFWQLFRSEQNERRLLYEITCSHMIYFLRQAEFQRNSYFCMDHNCTKDFHVRTNPIRLNYCRLLSSCAHYKQLTTVITVNIVGGSMLNMVMNIIKIFTLSFQFSFRKNSCPSSSLKIYKKSWKNATIQNQQLENNFYVPETHIMYLTHCC